MLQKHLIVLLSVFYKYVRFTDGANILYLCSLPSPSHHIWNTALADGLAARGHNITIISPDIDNNPPKGVHYIYLEGIYNDDHCALLKALFNVTELMNPIIEPINYNRYAYSSCKIILETNGFRTLFQYPDDFRVDLIIYDFTHGACLLAFMHKFNYPPLVSVTAYGNPTLLNALIGGHQYYSYIPHYYLHYENDMNIWQRLYNFAVHMVELYDRFVVFNPKLDKLVREKFGSAYNSVSTTDLEQKTAIALVNTDPIFYDPAPLPPNVIPVGGLNIRDTKPLPKDLETFINSSNKGAILFSLGTNVRSSSMDIEKQKILLDAFAQFPDYHFIWKFEQQSTDLMLPKNIMIRPWLPQSDILAHQKTRAFFTHSGMLSTIEAIWRGVPILGMPFAYDQHRNLIKCIQLGVAERIHFRTMTKETLTEKLKQILENPRYTENMKKLSARFRDQKEKPLDRAVWWIEWLLRNPNAEVLKSPVLKLGFIRGNSYDLIAIVTLVLTAILLLVGKIIISYVYQFVKDWNQNYCHFKTE